jgi:uncharacterized DUF497 family protein
MNDVIYDNNFIWNRDKAAENVKKHGISFEVVTKVFLDPFGVYRYDDEHSEYEDRFNIIGVVDGVVCVSVFFTDRNGLKRIFSARKAEGEELEIYARNFREIIGDR